MAQQPFLTLGTRGSPLALAQAHEVRARLMAAHGVSEEAIVIAVMSTAGDRILDRPLAEVGGKGLFTAEIEEALLAGRIDLAVHSSKDMPTTLPNGLALTCFLEREDVRDVFIGRTAKTLADLPQGARVGSSSLRRQAILKRMRPDLEVVTFRGNVQTRLRKLEEGQVDGTMLALAGLKRLGMADVATEILGTDRFLPAVGQGAIAIETRVGDARVAAALAPLDHAPTHKALLCERAFLRVLDGSCRTPISGHAKVSGETLVFDGLILRPDGSQHFALRREGLASEAEQIGREAGEALKAQAPDGFFGGA